MPEAIVLAIRAGHADAILDGRARYEHRSMPPTRLPARAYLAVVEDHSIVGECELGAPTQRSAWGWALPVTKPRRYRAPRPLSEFGLEKIPRSFRYIQSELVGPARGGPSSPAARRRTRARSGRSPSRMSRS